MNNEHLLAIAKKFQKDADMIKIVTTARSQKNNGIILSLYGAIEYPLIAFSMGVIGQQTRIDCLAHGALWTYCSIGRKKIASGQMSLGEMAKEKIYCVIGSPIRHSMSPVMHNKNFKSLGLNANYSAVQVSNLSQWMKTVQKRDIHGINVTMPYKTEVMKYLDEIDPLAEKIGAVNTIHNRNGKLIGYNTDAFGALQAIKEKTKKLKNRKVIILGSGGAARAISFILEREKTDVVIISRNIKKAKEIGKALKYNNKNIKEQLQEADILINCTPIGMNSNETPVPKESLNKNLVVFDIVYTPIKTKLIRDAEEKGCETILGYKMLAFQGAQSFQIWTGKKPNVSIMLDAVKKQLLPSIVLTGFMGSGKTSVGKILAKDLGREFIDIDEEIEKKEKMSIKNIFRNHGEKHFRKLENEILRDVASRKNVVISCGGGIVLEDKNRQRLKSFITVNLKAEPRTIAQRLSKDKSRPLLFGLSNKDKIKKISRILKERENLYKITADYSVKTDGLSKKESEKEIMRSIIKI